MIYENKNYKVEKAEDGEGYTVTNLTTGVIEFSNPSLPRSIIVAVESDSALDRYLPKEAEEATDETNVVRLR